MKRSLCVLAIVASGWLVAPAGGKAFPQSAGDDRSRQVEWLYYGADPGGTKFSPLADVTRENVQQLQIAWQWKHWEAPLPEYGTAPGFFENFAVPQR